PAEVRRSAIPLPEHPPRIATAIPALPNIVRDQTEPFEPAVSPMPRVPTGPTTCAAYRNAYLGFALKYPPDAFALGRHQTDAGHCSLPSKVGRLFLRIFAIPNRTATTLAQCRRSLIAQRYVDATFDNTYQQQNWFVLSGRGGEEIFYERVTFSCDRR